MAAAGNDGVVRLPETRASFLVGRGYLPDIADALILCAEDRRPGNHVFHVQDKETLTWEDWWRIIAEVSNWKGRFERVPDSETDDPAVRTQDLTQHLYMDTSKIRRELGYTETVPMDEAVRRSVEWEQSKNR